ncbi:MAG: hypothetical protein ABSH23_02785 [Steroidobacteraceae bacterium]
MSTPDSRAAGDAGLAAQLRRFLELGAAQLDAAMRESDARAEQLASSVSAVATDALALAVQARALDCADAGAASQARRSIRHLADALGSHVQATIHALQFYDKLIQRLTHVCEGLTIPVDSTAAELGGAAADFDSLLEQVRSRYSMVEERVLFDFMMRGLSAEQMLNALTGLRNAGAPGELEVF